MIEAKLLALNAALMDAGIPFAFGGAIAQNYYGEVRATTDLDINVFLLPSEARQVLDVLSGLFFIDDIDRYAARITRDSQVRVPWAETLVDLFFTDMEFHQSCSQRVRRVPFGSDEIPILSLEDLIVCKIAFDRAKDWFDLRKIFAIQADSIDREYLSYWMGEFFESTDPRIDRLSRYLR